MLKKRVIPVLLLSKGKMVKGKQFQDFRETGKPNSAVRIYSSQDTDELVFLDIEASRNNSINQDSLVKIIRSAAEECFMPLAAGGGVNSLAKVRQLILAGADKVVINTAAVTDPDLIRQTSEQFGSQCVIAGVDYRNGPNGERVWIKCGSVATELDPVSHACNLVKLGVGEIFLNSIDRDGMMDGYDIEIADKVANAVPVPVIVCGGAGNFMHLAELLDKTESSAAACASLFHFGDNSPIRARSYLRNLNIPMRNLK
jgi:imidazole glycerol-phosphate synthase subunit HisF